MARVSILAEGVVQGVGMRPFVFCAARDRGLVGWVRNGSSALHVEAQGDPDALRDFVDALERCPPPAAISRMLITELEDLDDDSFRILESDRTENVGSVLPADLAICADCALETDASEQRRFRYPFTNCTRCGPRYTIALGVPYDRPSTSMDRFAMCAHCRAEYEDPTDRRFHAQAIACPTCGPTTTLLDAEGAVVALGDAALVQCVRALAEGQVLALKGLGGFQLLVDAMNATAVTLLRTRKRREAKPFAVLFASVEALREYCSVSEAEARALTSPEAPIVLVRRRAPLAEGIAPDNPWIGAMLPCTPLHRLLARQAARPLVCTSGNLSEEPMCTNEVEALERLGIVADRFLVHDRPIVRPVDDSVARIAPDGELALLRRARGFAPLPLRVAEAVASVVALGGQLKSTVALGLAPDGQVVVSQHLGDLHSVEGRNLLERTVDDLVEFFALRPEIVACDLHPDYASTRLGERLAKAWGVPLVRVQHHQAHVAACMAEHGITEPVLGVAWDGAGYGTDGTLWGGELLICEGATFQRVGHLRPFALPGGERAMREPRRTALALLHAMSGRAAAMEHAARWFSPSEAETLLTLIERAVNAPKTTSIGRLFDGVAALAGVATASRFEGEAAMRLELAADGITAADAYPLSMSEGVPHVVDWEPLLRAVLDDSAHGVSASVISARFHEALAAVIERFAVRIGVPRVVLGGGCFQNVRLEARVRDRLARHGFDVYAPRRYPPNDGGLSLGQALVASRIIRSGEGGPSSCVSGSPEKS